MYEIKKVSGEYKGEMITKKYLCICSYGQVRSVAMAWFIHGLNREDNRIRKLKYEAIPIGSVTSSKKTMKMLKKWADVVIDVRKYIPLDKYGTPNNPELMKKVQGIWEEINSSKIMEIDWGENKGLQIPIRKINSSSKEEEKRL